MQIDFIELANFRRLQAARIDVAERQTLLVGANNSGKTSALVALRLFLKEFGGFSVRDISASNWANIETIAKSWCSLSDHDPREPEAFNTLLPAIDVWISIRDDELHFISHLIPSLDWESGKLGVRIRLEAKSFEGLVEDYRTARENSEDRMSTYKSNNPAAPDDFSLWPKSFHDYLDRKFTTALDLGAYLLDPEKIATPDDDQRARPQILPESAQPISGRPFSGLIHIREINAQRGFADASESKREDNQEGGTISGGSPRRLSDQLQAYFRRHLDPNKDPTDEDVSALGAIHMAQSTFDQRLKQGFNEPIEELENLGYPGMTNPKLSISTRLRPTDGLEHPSAVQYDVGGDAESIRLPENYSGLGFQNLISMIFQLMRFRDEWMRVGKLSTEDDASDSGAIPPLQLILVEEPEAHLHTQVQQVFIREAYNVLRNHDDLGSENTYRTQLIVSTHSNHIAHEMDITDLRYFKRQPPTDIGVPTSVIANPTGLFGEDTETTRFTRRYLRATHYDLFFADGVILVEGAAERILMPHFIRQQFPDLARRYISLLEIGGSHAHMLKPLIDLLSIPTLIITDLDAVDPANNKAIQPKIGANQVTANMVLKTWAPRKTQLDDILKENLVTVTSGDGYGVVGVFYQREIEVAYPKDSQTMKLIPSTFEDALALANLSVVADLSGVTMTNAIAKIVKEGKDVGEIAKEMFERLRKRPEKAAFALDILASKKLDELVAPDYIAAGLTWLEKQLKGQRDVS